MTEWEISFEKNTICNRRRPNQNGDLTRRDQIRNEIIWSNTRIKLHSQTTKHSLVKLTWPSLMCVLYETKNKINRRRGCPWLRQLEGTRHRKHPPHTKQITELCYLVLLYSMILSKLLARFHFLKVHVHHMVYIYISCLPYDF